MKLREFTSATKRRQALEKELQMSLMHTGKHLIDETAVANRNCENMIGATQVPLGVAGAVQI